MHCQLTLRALLVGRSVRVWGLVALEGWLLGARDHWRTPVMERGWDRHVGPVLFALTTPLVDPQRWRRGSRGRLLLLCCRSGDRGCCHGRGGRGWGCCKNMATQITNFKSGRQRAFYYEQAILVGARHTLSLKARPFVKIIEVIIKLVHSS